MNSIQHMAAGTPIAPPHPVIPLSVETPAHTATRRRPEPATGLDTPYRIVEIFETLQGEGFNTGMPSIFIRFGKCNLACPCAIPTTTASAP